MPDLRPLPPVPADPGARGIGHFVRRNPVLVILFVLALVAAGAVGLFIASNVYPPTTHLTVDLYTVDRAEAGDGFAVLLRRVTHRPASGIAVRRGGAVIFEWPELVQIDGLVRNDSGRYLAAFHRGEALLTSPKGRTAGEQIISNGNQCKAEGWPKDALDIAPGGERRFSIFLKVDRDTGARWVRDSVKDRILPGLKLGEFAFSDGPCGNLDEAMLPASGISVEFGPSALDRPEIRDFYPFGQSPVPEKRPTWPLWVFEPPDLKQSVR